MISVSNPSLCVFSQNAKIREKTKTRGLRSRIRSVIKDTNRIRTVIEDSSRTRAGRKDSTRIRKDEQIDLGDTVYRRKQLESRN